ncbi:beta-ketoacyl-ACP synthase III [Candidatus Rariloculus sp.]|uniref:beta-ketoacyl-ACP synthase III n=1 Tax=Candidatus Rariloculus sp. TaxID=3101265 RepID=UPI003D0F4237
MYSRIAGTGKYLPERVLTNFDLEAMVDTTDEWIRTRTGIERRHLVADDEFTSDLAYNASLAAIEDAGLDPRDIDFILVGTTTPDLIFPNVGCLVQERLGIRGVPAFSLEAACSGFLYALGVADQFVRGGQAKCALVIGAEAMSRIVDWTDRETCVLFGDGAGAVILERADDPGIMYSSLGADGRYRDLLYASSGVSVAPKDKEGAALRMKGNEVFKVAVKTLGYMVDEVLEKNGLEQGEIDWFIPHQANIRIIQAMARRLQMPMERVVLTIKEHGNTSAASVPMALDTAIRDGRIKRGDLLLLEAFGGGFTWGASLVRY